MADAGESATARKPPDDPSRNPSSQLQENSHSSELRASLLDRPGKQFLLGF
jgi:hypothetical protein